MFYVRVVFLVGKNYDFNIQDEFILFESENAVCRGKIDRRTEDVKVILSYGEFEDRETAEKEGNKLFYSVKKLFIKKGIPINISGGLGVLDTTQMSFNTGGLTEYGLKNIGLLFPQLASETVKNETLGMEIYQLDKDISEVKFLSQSATPKLTLQFPEVEIDNYKEDKKLNTAYSLLNSSNAINDLRASFLLKVSTIESLVPEDSYKDDTYCYFLKQINKSITMENIKIDIDIPDTEKQNILQGIKSSFGLLKKKTIGEKCKELIGSCNFEKDYNGKNAIRFFDECYKIRSEFVHTGTYKDGVSETQKIRELETYKTELNILIIDVLEFYEKNLI
ncbi:hypothetical protein [Metabacillus litoralis]|uniref:hypothetical protein n=1 Tax=Metabacillus litoralis TaxID=152268 RepID=UPI000EF5BBAF|nr:hypothetical protein [Metabacillus litoralis]